MNGLHYSDTIANRVFTQQTSAAAIAGLAIPIYSATAVGGGLPILNPASSKVKVELISYDIVYVSGSGAATFDGVYLMAGQCTGVGTGTGCSVLTAVPPMNGLFGFGAASNVQSSNGTGTNTVTGGTATAPASGVVGAGVIRSLYSTNLEAATATAHGTLVCKYTFDGTAVFPPGTIWYLASIVASVSLYNITVCWKEMPA